MTVLDVDTIRNALTFYAAHWARTAKELDKLGVQFECAATRVDAGAARRCLLRAESALLAFNLEHSE